MTRLRHVAGLALGLALAAPGLVQGAGREVVVLMAKRIPSILAAVEALAQSGEKVETFDISKGLNEVDRLERTLKARRRTQAVIALGAAAHAYFRERGTGSLPYAATLLNSPEDSPKVVGFTAPPEAWVEVLTDLGRPGPLVVPHGGKVEALEPLRAALAAAGRELKVVAAGEGLGDRLRVALPGAAAVLYLRDPKLLTKRAALGIMRAAQGAGVPVLGFTRKLLGPGAAVALEVTPESAAHVALARALGEPEPELVTSRHENAERLRALGLTRAPK